MGNTITSANAIIMLSVNGVFSTPVQLQGFGPDELTDSQAIKSAEVQMGVDGTMSAGFVYVPAVQSVTLAASSTSNAIFDAWWSAMYVAAEAIFCNGTIVFRSTGKKWIGTNGILTGYKILPDAGKLLKAQKHEITWESLIPAPTL
jgi:hypothetical protein